MNRNLTVAAGALAAFGIAAAAYAQTTPPPARPAAPAAARPALNPGPMIPGVCTFWEERAIGTSTVGKQFSARLKALTDAAQAELRTEAQAIDGERRALEAQRASPTMTQEQLEQRILLLQQRAGAFERKAAQRGRELQATEQKALTRIATELQPLIGAVYNERNCGMMLNRNMIVYSNPQMDVTDAVVTKLNAKLTTLGDFPREPDPQAAGRPPAAAPAARPAAPAPAGKKK
jgi:outer membrane protein